ncbi:STAS domain-containing protein [Kitasatospora sp. NPDC059571]|uniref:STAS domain-containing protein n=1 Tax=Kitasatospora sp. NPDC059571 TaxID=3346871 RepID=UPI0036A6190A
MSSGTGGRAPAPAEDGRIRVLVLTRSDGPTIRVAGEIDRHTAPVLVDALSQPWAAMTPPAVVRVDLAAVEFCDSSALRALLDAERRAAAHGSALLLVHPSRQVIRLLELSGVDAELAVAG